MLTHGRIFGDGPVPYFAPYELRHTFATRLSAGGVADAVFIGCMRVGVIYGLQGFGASASAHCRGRRINFEHTFAHT